MTTERVPAVPTIRACGDCGFSATYRTPGLAAYHFPRHSCANHRARTAIAARVAARAELRAADLGPKRDCGHPIARHVHGTRQAFVLDRCRCLPCKDANLDYEHERSRAHLYGRWTHRTDAGPARQRLLDLQAAGVSYKQVSRITGVSATTLATLLYGRHDRRGGAIPKTIGTEQSNKILAFLPDPFLLSDRARVDATGTHRRVQALVCLGWSLSKIGSEVTVAPNNFWKMMHADQVRAATARAVRDLYEQLWNTAPPATNQRERISVSRSKRYAADRGWLPPLAWDDDTIDDPTAERMTITDRGTELDEIAIERAMGGDPPAWLSKHDRAEAVRRLTADGMSAQLIAERMRITSRTVTRRRASGRTPTTSTERLEEYSA